MFGLHKSGRSLTVGERTLAESVFGSALDYDDVRIHNYTYFCFQPRRVVMAPNGHIWFHPKSDLYCSDFCDASLSLQGLLIHELVHVWQHQKNICLPLRRHPFCRYDYILKPGWKLDQYGLEQQAEIVRHVFLLRNGVQVTGAPPLSQYDGVLPF